MTFSKIKHGLAAILVAGSVLLTASIQAETYTVKAGDTLSEIASVFHTTAEELATLNQIEDKNLIMIGQELKTSQAVTAATEQVLNTVATPEPVVEEVVHTEAPASTTEVTTVQHSTEAVTTQTSTATQTPVQATATVATAPSSSAQEAAAKEEIARRESGGSYTAQNGQFYGRYQLMLAYLNGDLSPENQERVADAYVYGRYGSWTAALAHSNAKGWY